MRACFYSNQASPSSFIWASHFSQPGYLRIFNHLTNPCQTNQYHDSCKKKIIKKACKRFVSGSIISYQPRNF
ncbi:hypothetical protein EUGRSUZ_K03342 [Eucalyptus grandis]|uniref:Uncharacterized protein n=2 Tax=Eucalyptus grandis TaxID=71139 RepID=A0ACC3J0W7_EUCGR|nr:hypothetical protein EUGRSUZ_K03342 [Eucalyptus grandis]